MIQFFQTGMGKAFYQGQIPEMIRQAKAMVENVGKLAAELKRYNDNCDGPNIKDPPLNLGKAALTEDQLARLTSSYEDVLRSDGYFRLVTAEHLTKGTSLEAYLDHFGGKDPLDA